MTQSQATSKLESAGFAVNTTTETSKDTKGTVTKQSKTGTATKGTTITITISSGPGEAPNVVGMSKSKATSTLENAGFTVTTKPEPSKDVAEGNVISQSTNGSTVTLTISSGPSGNNTVPGESGNN